MKIEFEKQFGQGVDPWYAKAERWAKKQKFPISFFALGLIAYLKKVTDFVKKKLGKKPYVPSRNEIQANRYRQSKGLNPLNFEKMKKKG